MSGMDYAATRSGIATLLRDIPQVNTVSDYVPGTARSANVNEHSLPHAVIWLESDQAPAAKQAHSTLGAWDHTCTWTIAVWIQLVYDSTAQQDAEIVISAIRQQFDDNKLIDPNGPGVCDTSSITAAKPAIDDSTGRPIMFIPFTLTTFTRVAQT